MKLAAKAGEHYAVEVAPREASFLLSMLFGIVGAAIDASVNENAGALSTRRKAVWVREYEWDL